MHAESQVPTERGPGYEVRDTNVKAIVTFLVGLTIFVIIVQVVLWGLLKAISSDKLDAPAPLTAFDIIAEQRQSLRTEEDAKLGEKARMPIEAAIERLAREGIAPISPGKTSTDVNSHSGKPVQGGAK